MQIDSAKWATGCVEGQTQWTSNLFSLRVAATLPLFRAGQFGKLALPMLTDKGEELVARAYSFVNAPAEHPFEFYYITLPDGPLTTRLAQLRCGDTVYLSTNPHGFLTLAEAPHKKHLWMLSTGTALGPFLSILKSGEAWARFEHIVLVHAVRSAAELSYGELLKSIVDSYPGKFTFIPFVSRESSAYALGGRIPLAIEDGRLEKRAGISFSAENSAVMICGNPDMVKDTQTVLIARGMQRHRRREPGNFIVENYW